MDVTGQETSRKLRAVGRGARNILNIQGTNIESATKAEDRAKTRLFTGIGSQVEILSAQTALTDARDFYAVALRNYSMAYSELLRATGEDMLAGVARGPQRHH